MQRFVLSENIARFRERLAQAGDDATRAWLQGMLVTAERELALLDAARTGVRPRWDRIGPQARAAAEAKARAWFGQAFGEAPMPAALIDPKPGLAIVEVNPAYALAAGMTREQVVGGPLFETFPDNPADPAANGVANLYASLRLVAESGQEHVMALQRYDTQGSDGRWLERYWRPVNRPVLEEAGELIFLLHIVEEATGEVLSAPGA